MNDKLHQAQIEALRWLQGRVECQLVRSHIALEIELLERIGTPIGRSGGSFKFEQDVKITKPLPGQLDIEKELEQR